MASEVGLTQSAVLRIWRAFGLQPHRVRDLEALQGPAVHREGPRRRRALPRPARARGRALRRREVPDPGAGSHRADSADAARHPGARHPRLQARRHLQPLRRARHRHRQGDRLAARAPPRDRVQEVPGNDRPRGPGPVSTSTSCSTTPRTHKTPAIQSWLAAHPRFVLHFTPTSSSWLNLVERWFAELTTKKLRRGTHRSVRATQHRHPRLDRHLEPEPPTLRLDQDRRPDPRLHRPLLRTNQ